LQNTVRRPQPLGQRVGFFKLAVNAGSSPALEVDFLQSLQLRACWIEREMLTRIAQANSHRDGRIF
jgi:hypothetical protein